MVAKITDWLEPYQEVLEKIEKLDVEWTVFSEGLGGVRSIDNRCPLKELHYQRTGEDRMPTAEEVGLVSEQVFTFTNSADNSQGSVPSLREAIGKATRTDMRRYPFPL